MLDLARSVERDDEQLLGRQSGLKMDKKRSKALLKRLGFLRVLSARVQEYELRISRQKFARLSILHSFYRHLKIQTDTANGTITHASRIDTGAIS